MRERDKVGPFPVALASAFLGLGLSVVVFWLLRNPAPDIHPALPGQDDQPADRRAGLQDAPVDIRGVFVQGPGRPGRDLDVWPGFRGKSRDNIVERVGDSRLARGWEKEPPQLLWSAELGEGHAAPAVIGGRVFVLDYDEAAESDTLRCLSLDDGSELWRRAYRVPMKRNHGLSRTVPAVTEKYVVTLGPRCHVMCVVMKTGDFLWGTDLQADFGTKEPFWYAGQCPLIDGETAVIAPCGEDVLMAGFDCATGRIVWQTPNPDGWDMSHSSIMSATFAGKRTYVYCAVGGVIGVSAEPPDAGTVLWRISDWSPSVVAPSPVASGDGSLFVTAGYGAGSALLDVASNADGYSAGIVDQFGPRDGVACEQQTPILRDGVLYGILPKDAGGMRNQFVCAAIESPREILAASGKQARFGLGPFLLVEDTFLILNDDGTLVMAEMSPAEGYVELARQQILDGRDAWGPMALVGDRLLLRDDRILACVKLPVVDP